MSIRLYDSAWVRLSGVDAPQPVRKDRSNPAAFHIYDFLYDIDGRAYRATELVPQIEAILSLAAAREAGLSTQYTAPIDKYLIPASHY